MSLLSHIFALWFLAHLVWMALLLQAEWQRTRASAKPIPERQVKAGDRYVRRA
jgi:energy-converting hydrogenase Eha subunit F